MKCGWSREVTKRCSPNGKRNIVYRAPCGCRLRNMNEVHQYLLLTHCELSVDLFCYDNIVNCFREFQPDDLLRQLEGTFLICIPFFYDGAINKLIRPTFLT